MGKIINRNDNGIKVTAIIQVVVAAIIIGGFWRVWDTQQAHAVTLGQIGVRLDAIAELKNEVKAIRRTLDQQWAWQQENGK